MIDKFRFDYKGFGNCDSFCYLTILTIRDAYHNRFLTVVIFHEAEDNPGTSITNMSEYLAQKVKDIYFPNRPSDDVRWFEHYEYLSTIGETWDEVFYDIENDKYSHPRWKSSSFETVNNFKLLIGE